MRKHIVASLLAAFTLSSCQLIEDHLDGNQAPVVGGLVPDPSEGAAPLLVGFSWDIADVEGDTLSCRLIYGDGEEQTINNCGEVTNTFHTFEETGGYTVMLTVNDGLNRAVKSVAVRVLEAEVK